MRPGELLIQRLRLESWHCLSCFGINGWGNRGESLTSRVPELGLSSLFELGPFEWLAQMPHSLVPDA